jgi:hypothetical protein
MEMIMRAVCPENKEHNEFYTTAHVLQEWKVTPEGTFIEEIEGSLEVVHGPDSGNTWECAECGATAEVS